MAEQGQKRRISSQKLLIAVKESDDHLCFERASYIKERRKTIIFLKNLSVSIIIHLK